MSEPLIDTQTETGRRVLPAEATKAKAGGGTAIRIHKLSKQFAEQRVLQSLSLDIPPGQFVAIVGRSGCGKSTLLRLVAGLDSPSAGAITLPDAQPDTVRVMFQEARLLPWRSVQDNVALGLPPSRFRRAIEALAEVGLADKAHSWPSVLSGGQKQRVALARALSHSPRLLLLDEPLGALDALTRIDMQRLIESIWRQHGFTVLLVTHDVAEAVALADRVLLIENGQIGLDLPISLPRPRQRGSAEFAKLEAIILDQVLGQPQTEANVPSEPGGSDPHAIALQQLRWAC